MCPITQDVLVNPVVASDGYTYSICHHMFEDASSFNRPLNNWNVSNVRAMDDMFEEATSFNHALHAPWYVVEQSESE